MHARPPSSHQCVRVCARVETTMPGMSGQSRFLDNGGRHDVRGEMGGRARRRLGHGTTRWRADSCVLANAHRLGLHRKGDVHRERARANAYATYFSSWRTHMMLPGGGVCVLYSKSVSRCVYTDRGAYACARAVRACSDGEKLANSSRRLCVVGFKRVSVSCGFCACATHTYTHPCGVSV